ncbi:MAG TPA: fibronectin type III domain-containing protein [Terriglobales bacterium]|jgi:type IV secretory pathway VirB10-like protein|nr:fibronectin type III domain-containing protein [Terriglobales bacterium]
MNSKALKKCGLSLAIAAALVTLAVANPQATTNATGQARITSGPTIQYADDQFAVITWSTDISTDSRVFYGTDPENLNQVAESPYGGTTHRVQLTKLKPGMTYYFEIDTGQAEPGTGARHSFQTVATGAPPIRDYRPTQVSAGRMAEPAARITRGPIIQYADEQSAVITWSTSEPADSRVFYGTDRNNLTQTAEAAGGSTFHRVHLANLMPNTTYYFQVDTGTATGPVNSFRTVARGGPPVYDQQAGQATAQGGPVLGRRAAEQVPTSTSGKEVPAGTEIRAALETALSTKTSQVGDRFTALVTEPVRAVDGSVAIPAGSRINGEVTEAETGKTLPQLRGRGKLQLRFREVILPNGATVPLTATLGSVNEKATGEEGQVESGTKGSTAAKGVGIGAAIGTVGGLIFGSALKGLVIGAIAGGGYVLATKGKDVELPAQTGITLRLDHSLIVPATTGGR